MSYPHPRRICYVVSSEMTVSAFLKDHIAAASTHYHVTVVANTSNSDFLQSLGLDAVLHPIIIVRAISPWHDLTALLSLFRKFRAEHFDIVHSVSPKAGLLAMLAGRLAGVPRRVHTFTGQVWATRTGWKRLLLKTADRLMAWLATHVLADSPSQRDFMVAEGIATAEKIRVLGEGSICGVDGARFRPDPDQCVEIRRTQGIPEEAIVFLFLGRLNRDKGVLDLADAFAALGNPSAWLLVVGPDEAGLRRDMESRLGAALKRTRFVGYTERPEAFMAAADVFCMPSYREGFGMVIIEAAAAGIPTVASRIYGITDAVEDGCTGLLHPPGDVAGIAEEMTTMVNDPARRLVMGHAARERALRLFSRRAITEAWMRFYDQALA